MPIYLFCLPNQDQEKYGYNTNIYPKTNIYNIHFRILVGAPRDNITRAKDPMGGYDKEIYDVERPGAVYNCPLTSLLNDCTLLLLDTQGRNTFSIL